MPTLHTIAHLARDAGISRQGIHARIRLLGIKGEKVANVLTFTDAQARRIIAKPEPGPKRKRT
jgi:hypothetical protein